MKSSRGRHLTLTSNLSTCMPGCASYSCACMYTHTHTPVQLICFVAWISLKAENTLFSLFRPMYSHWLVAILS